MRFYIFYRYKPLISQRNCYKMNIMIYLALSDFGELIFVVALCHLSSWRSHQCFFGSSYWPVSDRWSGRAWSSGGRSTCRRGSWSSSPHSSLSPGCWVHGHSSCSIYCPEVKYKYHSSSSINWPEVNKTNFHHQTIINCIAIIWKMQDLKYLSSIYSTPWFWK